MVLFKVSITLQGHFSNIPMMDSEGNVQGLSYYASMDALINIYNQKAKVPDGMELRYVKNIWLKMKLPLKQWIVGVIIFGEVCIQL